MRRIGRRRISFRMSRSLPLIVASMCLTGAILTAVPGCGDQGVSAVTVAATERAYDVEGMTCMNCVNAIKQAVRRVDGIESCEVDLESGEMMILTAGVDDDTVLNAVRQLGFTIQPRP